MIDIDSTQQEAILIKDLVKLYKKDKESEGFLALDGLNLSIPKGSIFGLLGPNGAGKSTLINILASTVIKTSGHVSVFGHDIDQYPKKVKSLIGIVPQEIVYDTFFTIEQALEFTAGYFGVRPAFRKTEKILRAMGLWDKRHQKPQRLSGGMRRRFLVAKSMVHSPKILVLDEPTAGVDIELRTQLWDYVKELNKEGVTIIITTHYLAEAQELCDEIAFINKGKIVKQDSKNNLLKELGARHIDVEFTDNISEDEIGILKNLNIERLSGNTLRFNLKSSSDYLKVLEDIRSINKEVKDLHEARPDLEKIFHKIIK